MSAIDDLNELKDRWTGVQGHVRDLLPEVVELVERINQEANERTDKARAEATARWEGRVEQAELTADRRQRAAREAVDRAERLERALSDKRTIREEREAARGEHDVEVTITNGHVGWTVAGLEEVAYRLRAGGAEDDTPVDIARARARASVPAPNMVTLQDTKPAAAPVTPQEKPARTSWKWAYAGLMVALVALLVAVINLAH